MSKETGGTAFPAEEWDELQSHSQNRIVIADKHLGMSMRDYFAAKALQGICANPDLAAPTFAGSDHSKIAAASYSLADLMLSERAKP